MQKHHLKHLWKRSLSFGLVLSMTATLLPALPVSAAKRPGVSQSLSINAQSKPNVTKAGSVPVSEDTLTYDQPFEPFTAGCENFRIPGLITLQNGDLLATGDARWEEWNDGGGIDSIASVSSDNGKTWNYSFPIYFPDSYGYVGQGGSGLNTNSTTIIDPGVVEGPDGTIYFIADVNPTGSTTMYKSIGTGTGYVTVDGERYLALTEDFSKSYNTEPKDDDLTTYPYYIEHFNEDGYAKILKRSDHAETGYGVDEWFNLYTVTNGEYIDNLRQKQANSNTDIQQNVFYKGSKFHVYSIDYLWVVQSKDHGRTWEHPRDLTDQIKRHENEHALLVAPGKGLTTSWGDIVIGFYDYGDGHQDSSMVYSTDNGETWKRTGDVQNQSGDSSENEILELEDGTLRMFYRNNNRKLSYADVYKDDTTGEYTMGSEVKVTSVGVHSDCNLSVLSYSQKIDGKQLIFVSCPTSGRAAGKIFAFLVDDTKDGNPLNLYHTYVVPGGESGFVYSCLTELNDGSIGMLWEPNHSTMYFDTFDIYELLPEDVEFPNASMNVELEKGEEFTKYSKEGTPDISLAPDQTVAEAEINEEVQTLILRDHIADNASNLSSFSADVNKDICLQEAEYTFTGTAQENVWTVYNQSTKQYFTNNSSAEVFFNRERQNDMKFTPVSNSDGTKSFKICKGDTNNRYVIFHEPNMTFNSMQNSSDAANEKMCLLERKETAEETDIIPGYQRVSEIQDGHSYLIAYLRSDSVMLLYPANGVAGQTKLVGTWDQMEQIERKKISIKAVGRGSTKALIDGVTYYIKVKDSEIVLNPNDTYDIPSISASVPAPENSVITAGAYNEVETGLFDHKGEGESVAFSTDSFSDTKNSQINLEDAEFTFTGSGETWTIKHGTKYLMNKVNWPDTFFTDTETSMKVVKIGDTNTFKICRADFIKDAFNVDIKDRSSNLMGYIVFYQRGMEFRSYGTGVKDGGTHGTNPYGQHANYGITLLEKQSATSNDDVIPGYKTASSITSGKNYLISSVLEDGSVAVLYPDNGTMEQTKLAKLVKKGIRITAGQTSGESSVTVDGVKYKFKVQTCSLSHTDENNLEIVNAVAATCTEEGSAGDKVCKTCKKVIEKGEATKPLGHDWNTLGTTIGVTETADGVTVFTCKHNTSHTKSEVIATVSIYKNFMSQYEKANEKIENSALYEPESVAALQVVSGRAKDLLDNKEETPLTNAAMVPLATELKVTAGNVESIRTKLQEDLSEIIESMQPVRDAGKQPYYDTAVWDSFVAAFDKAISITETTPYAELKSATEELQEKGTVLQKIKYKTELWALYDEHKDKAQEDNTDVTWAVFTAARTAAKTVLDKQDADVTVAELLKAAADLKAAVKGLRTPNEALAPYISYTAPKAGEYPTIPEVIGSSEDDAHQTAIMDYAKNPVTFSKAAASSTLDIQRLDGVWGFNDQVHTGANNDKFDIADNSPIIMSFKLYLKKKPSDNLGLLTKGDTQYTVQATSSGLEFFTYQSGWKAVNYTISNNQLNQWLDILAVVDGKGKERIFVNDTASAIANAGTPSHCDDAFAIACQKQGESADRKFTAEFGYLADVKFYSGKEMTDVMKTAINLQTLGDDAKTVITNLVDSIEPTANITASPYHVSTVWNKSDGTKMSAAERFEENEAYTAVTTLKALGDYEFRNSEEFIRGVVKGVTTDAEGKKDAVVDVKVSNDKKQMTVTVSYLSCPCTISELRIEDAEINIPEGANSGTFELQPSVQRNKNGCTLTGHPNALESDITYLVVDAGTTGATVSDTGVVTATASGRAKIAVTAALSNGASLSKTITVQVKKEGVTYYTVTFHKNDGTDAIVDSLDIEENSKVNEPAAPIRTGYTFKGWYKDSNCSDGEEFDFENDRITEDTDLYAKWTENSSETVAVTGIRLDTTAFTLTGKGATKKLKATVEPSNATNKNVIWSSSDTSVATVSGGTVTAVAKGDAVITVTSEENSNIKAEASVKVDLDGTIALTAIKISPMRKTLTSIGATHQMEAEFTPENATNQEITWNSSDESVAAIDDEGVVTAKSEGFTMITAESADGKVVSEEARITVLVDDESVPVSKITLNKDKLELKKGQEETLKVSITPEDATNQNVIWSTSAPEIATVSSQGTVKAVKAGEAVITVTSEEDSDIKAEAVVTVLDDAAAPKTFIVIFHANDGGAAAPKKVSVSQGNIVTAPSVKRTGYNFAGWYQDAAGKTPYNLKAPVNANLTLYAKWNPIICKVSFNTNNGTSVASQDIPYNSLAKKPADPKKTGYKFVDWYSDKALTKKFNFAAKIQADITLFAKWESALENGVSHLAGGIRYTVTDAAAKTVTVAKGENKKAKSVKIPAVVNINGENCTVVGIANNAFKGYSKMNSLTIEANLKSIGKNAFNGCKKLKKVTLKVKTVPKMKSSSFKKVTSKVTVKASKLSKKQKTQFEKALKRAGMKKAKVK